MGVYEFIKSLDIFGAQINFYIKSNKKYTSFCGGLIFLLYSIACPIYILINLISFIKRSNISVIHYSKEIFATDEISFYDKTSSFAIGLECDKYDNSYGNLEELFDLEFNYISRKKINGTSIKNKYKVPLHTCTYDDFHEELRDDLDINKITTNYYCPSERNHTIKGIITDESFSFYEIILVSNNDSKKDIYNELTDKYDCKFNLYYTDVSIDVTNVYHPISYYLNNLFIQLASIYFKKVDVFFNIKSFKDDENLFFTFPEKTKYLTFVETEQYDIYRGEDRFIKKYEDYKKYAKYFIKADKTRTIIERRCQKFPEFVASIASILTSILSFLHLIIDWVNYSFAMKNIINSICDDQKNVIKQLILIKKTIIQKQFNDTKISGLIGKIDDSKIKISTLSQAVTLDELNRKSVEIKSYNNTINNNFNIINNYDFDIKKNNFINFNSDVKTNEKSETENQLGDKTKNTSKLSNITPLKCIEMKNNFKNNNQIRPNKIDSYEVKLKTKNRVSILNYIIKESIIKFYLCNIFPSYKKKQMNIIDNNEIFLEKYLKQLIIRLDITNYLKKLNQLETLFQILFKSSDLNLFNNFSKFNLNGISVEDEIFNIFDNFNEQERFRNYYIQLLNNPSKTIFEERLENLIRKEMNEL